MKMTNRSVGPFANSVGHHVFVRLNAVDEIGNEGNRYSGAQYVPHSPLEVSFTVFILVFSSVHERFYDFP